MEQLSIKVKVAGTEYPLRVNSEDEELILNAASIINERYFEFENKFSHVREKKDILAMAFLQIMVDHLRDASGNKSELNRLQIFAQEVNSMLQEHQGKIKGVE
ncbi:MAG: cell division protein ZapA [Bacteroidota bacterium]